MGLGASWQRLVIACLMSDGVVRSTLAAPGCFLIRSEPINDPASEAALHFEGEQLRTLVLEEGFINLFALKVCVCVCIFICVCVVRSSWPNKGSVDEPLCGGGIVLTSWLVWATQTGGGRGMSRDDALAVSAFALPRFQLSKRTLVRKTRLMFPEVVWMLTMRKMWCLTLDWRWQFTQAVRREMMSQVARALGLVQPTSVSDDISAVFGQGVDHPGVLRYGVQCFSACLCERVVARCHC